ncbi:2-succinyl-5-enolpyruvyl-6-hydroxy-3-cyclohexene-1-carboxylic-acid synthase [Corynebacterium sp. 320]|uniref:thiamine pyrophosphate-binding protein n=1 Tax=Corynebacterium TaxID=1716 RepID=UPI00125CBD29|nr:MULTISPECIES: thiamine pyrophosphate-binding protein [Corynebacterium]KAB1504382.1 2-succinyl-5-enolpyruvyl-6-hydroxy-3-cyclohexene-1-carboxylic-acid synthase [Corynebacterium sp. 320]KAB1552519.1 2-succinyl-5-enolpyruvyl-6-hydroxy-3-cyclohexene-1-carboxylic-acid synthase [Corynebacterium sp. 321]KAB3528518.1 2-succinyl-5-enolpyruvyl-6-hydroxy-3-cyclohexene-1-carboxylic-acid synthase [Corynebacterium sp. 250]QNP92064.1 2-succinyl-5-enolpyruvyl-6-hydroxy-3-cyclohexene-1-carboxylic-acid syntha
MTEKPDVDAPDVDTPDVEALDVEAQGSVVVGVTVVDQLIRAGVREAVVCPGSRSAPLALAFAEADRTGRVRVHVRTDERTAAFLALGLAKASGRVVPVVMTSGTAVANCLPAMVEASMAGVPLMVLSANRPLALVGTGANQTIEQAEIFGVHARATLTTDGGSVRDLVAAGGGSGAADADASELGVTGASVRRVIDEAVAAALNPLNPGGVHVDVPLEEPLVPESTDVVSLLAREAASEAEPAGEVAGREAGNGAAHEAAAGAAGLVSGADIASGAARDARENPRRNRALPYGEVGVDLAKRTLVIAGSSADEAWARAISDELADVPTIAEPTAAAPDFPVHSAAIGMFTAGVVAHGEYSAMTRPEHIILVGRPTLHRAVTALLKDPDIPVTVLTDVENYPTFATNIVQVGSRIRLENDSPQAWLDVCRGVSDMGAEAVRQALRLPRAAGSTAGGAENSAAGGAPFSAAHAVAVVADSLSVGDLLVLGASTAVRDASRAGLPFDGVRTLANRGAAGIDGTISTAIGAALAHAAADPTAIRAPRTVAVMGDLTFLHDATALNIGPHEPRPSNMLIVVTNDNGGGIFETLEPGRDALRTFGDGTPAFERVFGTPTGANIEDICHAFSADYHQATSVEDLARIVEEHEELGNEGITVVEAVVDRAWRRTIEQHIVTTVNPQR